MLQRMKNLFKATDMTVGEPWKQIVMFTLPMLIGNIAQQLYSTVDSIVVGKYVGDSLYHGFRKRIKFMPIIEYHS